MDSLIRQAVKEHTVEQIDLQFEMGARYVLARSGEQLMAICWDERYATSLLEADALMFDIDPRLKADAFESITCEAAKRPRHIVITLAIYDKSFAFFE